MHPVVRVLTGDQERAVGLTAELPVPAGHLRRRVDESDPPLVRKTFESGTGARPATRSASSIAGRFDWSPKVEYADRRTICRYAASAISSRP